jgi:hypothetical protein
MTTSKRFMRKIRTAMIVFAICIPSLFSRTALSSSGVHVANN